MPKWRWGKRTVTITMSVDEARNLGRLLNEWESWVGWSDREDCRGWNRSPIARENRRESITYGNCLTSIKAYLGYDGTRKLMEMAGEGGNEAT